MINCCINLCTYDNRSNNTSKLTSSDSAGSSAFINSRVAICHRLLTLNDVPVGTVKDDEVDQGDDG